ncbi:MAG: 4-(cytidine 5'-diphospho)-2-C-methyl-D-erythritol kinase [Desulfomonilia bacterium]
MKILSPAKINLYLKVLGKRPDGYHELRTIMMPVSLYDEIVIERIPEGIQLHAPGCDCAEEENLALRAAQAFMERTTPASGVSIMVKKHIPVGAGLGGGSSDAASVLLGMNSLLEANLPEEDLATLAASLGADCPFFIHGRPLLLGGRGDIPLQEIDVEERSYLIVIPPFGVSTARIFSAYTCPLTLNTDGITIDSVPKRKVAPEEWLENDLEQVVFQFHPELEALKEELICCGASAALMSGSGSAVFGVFRTHEELCNGMGRLNRHGGYRYVPATTVTGEQYGDYRGQSISGQG